MLAQSASEEDSTASVVPPVKPSRPWRVQRVEALPDFVLRVRFLDGLEGEVDLAGLIHSARAGVFGALAIPGKFEEVSLELGAVVWPCGLDLAPDAMHRAISAKGRWVL